MINYKKFMILEKTYRDGTVRYYPYVRKWLGWGLIDHDGQFSFWETMFGADSNYKYESSNRQYAVSKIQSYIEKHKVTPKIKKTYFTKLDMIQ